MTTHLQLCIIVTLPGEVRLTRLLSTVNFARQGDHRDHGIEVTKVQSPSKVIGFSSRSLWLLTFFQTP